MAVVETLRLLKPANVGCDKHNQLEARSQGDYVPEWLEIPHTTLKRLKRSKTVEAVTVEQEELLRFEERHEELWGSDPELDEEQDEVSEEAETESSSEDIDTDPEVIEEEEIEDLGPVDGEEEKPAQKKVVSTRRRSTRRSKT